MYKFSTSMLTDSLFGRKQEVKFVGELIAFNRKSNPTLLKYPLTVSFDKS